MVDKSIPITVKPLIDSVLENGIKEFIDASQYWDGFDSLSLNRSCVVMEFKVDSTMKGLFFSDSTIFINHKICKRAYLLDKYKGVLSVNNIHVAIFDENDYGSAYYNADSLKMVPFSEFECYSVESYPGMAYYIRNGTLNYWNP